MRTFQLTALFMQKWNGSFFVKTTLQTLSLRYQLSHSGAPCPCPQAGLKNFVVFDISGPHRLAINYCQCSDEPLSNWVQLLCERWFPAMLLRLQTVFTFDCLETFHELTLQGKTNLYNYYHTLLRLSDNASLSTPIVSQYTICLIPGSDVNSTDTMKSIASLECGGT